jgi:predicted nucleic acid-binding protein
MPDEVVLDASAAVKVFLDEPGSASVRALVAAGVRFAAPGLVLAELANVLLKRLRRRETTHEFSTGVLERAAGLFDELVRVESLADRAFSIAAAHHLSAYDGLYVALAEAKNWPLATADIRLADRLTQSRLPIAVWTP